ncbi:radical SAM protein [Halobacteriovorax marinus]|uniref:Radical SAM protein n=1 Tax=Halobacteriovorax marinus TaxID=97084 RepID=A0A1Y5FDT9_9BACT|nr:radical SAM protein [Halobacteriovorax marinus]
MTAYKKWENLYTTAKNDERGKVPFTHLKTLWFNTGTLCNLACENCYIESNPKNDRLTYLSLADVTPYLAEIRENQWQLDNIAFTGGEPFLNPAIIDILEASLKLNIPVLVLTNAHKVIKRWEKKLLALHEKYGDLLRLRVSLDHYTSAVHEQERGENTFDSTMGTFKWLVENGFNMSIAGRSLTKESSEKASAGYQKLLDDLNIKLQLTDQKLVVFPEMKPQEDVPEISINCWQILGISPKDQMCSTERMIVKRKGQDKPVVLSCTLIAYDETFELGHTLKESFKDVHLNHPFCAKFCVLGGASCSSTS